MRQFLRERPIPQECSEPTAIDDTHRGTQVILNALPPFPFSGDADPASSLPACPQSGIGFGRILVFYELDDPPPACVTTLRLAKGPGGEAILTW